MLKSRVSGTTIVIKAADRRVSANVLDSNMVSRGQKISKSSATGTADSVVDIAIVKPR